MKIASKITAVLLAVSMLLLGGCGEKTDSAVSSVASKKSTVSVESKAESMSVSSEAIVPEKNDYSQRTYKFTEITEYLKINGRYAVTKAGEAAGFADCIAFDHTANMISFNADCEGDVTITLSVNSAAEDGREPKYFLVIVDGVEQRMVVKGTKTIEVKAKLTIATGLKRGNHTFEIYRQTEASHGFCNLISVTMNGVPTARPKNKDLYIEFFGDSITAGYGNLTTVEDEVQVSYPEKSSGTDTYAFLTAKALNADMSAVAQSGVAYTWGQGSKTIYDFWENISFTRPNLGKYQAERQPDVVVLALGTNDHNFYEKEGYTREQLHEEAVKLLTQVRKDRPNAKIVWYYGILNNTINKEIKEAIEEVGGEAKGFYYCEDERRQNGGGWHPSKEDHIAGAQTLTNFLKDII